jgi:hypothetical protein
MNLKAFYKFLITPADYCSSGRKIFLSSVLFVCIQALEGKNQLLLQTWCTSIRTYYILLRGKDWDLLLTSLAFRLERHFSVAFCSNTML